MHCDSIFSLPTFVCMLSFTSPMRSSKSLQVVLIANSLAVYYCNIETLILSHNRIGSGTEIQRDRACVAIADLLRTPMVKLKLLDLSWNHIKDTGVTEIGASLYGNTSLRELRLSYNAIGDEGGKALQYRSGSALVHDLDEVDEVQVRGGGGLADDLHAAALAACSISTLNVPTRRQHPADAGATHLSPFDIEEEACPQLPLPPLLLSWECIVITPCTD